jgi:hypothetical protein
MNPWILSFLVFSASFTVNAQPSSTQNRFHCGTAQIDVINSDDVKDPNFKVLISKEDQRLEVNYPVQREYLFVRCDQTSQGIPILIVSVACGGSGCVENNFGIIDPKQMKVLLDPNRYEKTNHISAMNIMGKPIQPFSCGDISQVRPMIEFCYKSPLSIY